MAESDFQKVLSTLVRSARDGFMSAGGDDVPGDVCVFTSDVMSTVADLLEDVADDIFSAPITQVRDFRIPGWVGSRTNAIVLSDSDDKRVIRLLEGLVERCHNVFVISRYNGGSGIHIMIPESTPSERIWFAIGAVLSIVSRSGYPLDRGMFDSALDSILEVHNSYKQSLDGLVDFIEGRVPAIYSTSDISAASNRWRDVLSLRGPAFSGELPEFDHNELVGWSDLNSHAPDLRMIVLRGSDRIGLAPVIVDCMTEVLEENGRHIMTLYLGGGGSLVKDLTAFALAESLYARLEAKG